MSEQAPPQVEVTEPQWPDPSTLPAHPLPQPAPPFIAMHSPVIQSVVGSNGLLININGGYVLNQAGLNKKMAGIAQDRHVNLGNIDQLSTLGFAEGDMLWWAWGLDPTTGITRTHPVETNWLTKTAYRTLTPKGAVNGLLPRGMKMVETAKKEITRDGVTTDGVPTSDYVVLRLATTVPDRYLVSRINPIASKAAGYVQTAIDAITSAHEEWPEADELWVEAFQAINTEIGGKMAGGLRELGMGYKPAEITAPKPSKKAASE